VTKRALWGLTTTAVYHGLLHQKLHTCYRPKGRTDKASHSFIHSDALTDAAYLPGTTRGSQRQMWRSRQPAMRNEGRRDMIF